SWPEPPELSPLLETKTSDFLEARPLRSQYGSLAFFKHLSLANQRVVRISVADDRRVLAGGGGRGQQRAQRGKSSRATYGGGAPVARRPLFLRGPEGEHRRLDRAAERARQHGADRNGERADRLTDGARVRAPLVAQHALSRTVIEVHRGLILPRVVGVGVPEVDDVAARPQPGQELCSCECLCRYWQRRRDHECDGGDQRHRGHSSRGWLQMRSPNTLHSMAWL